MAASRKMLEQRFVSGFICSNSRFLEILDSMQQKLVMMYINRKHRLGMGRIGRSVTEE